MKRFTAYDPPEYVSWQSTPEVRAEFKARASEGERGEVIAALSNTQLLELYERLLLTRLHDVQLKRWVKQGVITKAWLGTGEEAVTIGMCAALDEGDKIGPMIRNAGALISRDVPLEVCFAAYLGTTDTLARGRDLHIGDPERGVIPPISHVGDLVPVMAGCALEFKLRAQPNVAITWTGDGSTATGAFHEGMRMAGALGAPLLSVIQDNEVALGTPHARHNRGDFMAMADVYGASAWRVDGNNVLDCYAAAHLAREATLREGRPALLLAETFRMGGHATHDEREARSLIAPERYAYWGARDPVACFEVWLTEERGVSAEALAELEARCEVRIDEAARYARSRKESHAPQADEQQVGVFAPSPHP